MFKWIAAALVLALSLALMPAILRAARKGHRSGGSGVGIALGIVFTSIFDPKSAEAMEIADRKNATGDTEAGESGEKIEPGHAAPKN